MSAQEYYRISPPDPRIMDREPKSRNRVTESLLYHDLARENDNFPHKPRSGLVSRLGKFSIAVLVLSFFVVFGCLAFLTFLWAADTDNYAWREIVVSGWVTRSVTISALALRWATAAQAVTCTSMLASVLLEVYAVPLSKAAAVSILRADNTGPWVLLKSMRLQWHRGSLPIAIMALLTTFTTLALQFTSTALLSQVGTAYIPVPVSIADTFYGTDPDGVGFGSQISEIHSYLDTTPKAYPAFAEWVANTTLPGIAPQYEQFAPVTAPGLRDTGTVMRAFLPINNTDDRNRLVEYHGIGTVVDMRVVCMRPTLHDVQFSMGSGYRVTGRGDINTTLRPLGVFYSEDEGPQQKSGNLSMTFDCGFAAAISKNYSVANGWPISLCSMNFDREQKGILSVMESKIADLDFNSRSFLLVNATRREGLTDLDDSDLWEHWTVTSNDTEPESDIHASLQFTLCMTAFEAQELEIDATRPPLIIPEAAPTWNALTGSYETRDVQRQLGAGNSSASASERGIFDLAPRRWLFTDRPMFVSLTGGSFSTTWAMDRVSGDIYPGMINDALYSIFAQMAKATRDPALALQGFFTILFGSTYYDRMVMFDSAAPSFQVSMVEVIRPLGWTAYIVVVGVVVSHLVLVLLTIIVFFSSGKLSRMGNSWVAVSQILGPGTEEWIRSVDMVDDKTVEKWLKYQGMDRTLVRVEDVGGRVQLVRKTK
ncbi:hypothetical protein H2200_000616 [Cladophialophora chaetospira]|uniref:Uncharacterized protein n=1 Tax=Cladophialophora chaetospira TaxID=386627 RepID=A0AA38XPL6_9EURO|nr:hypothetical protein H2200_000616 [Cladophialophora chaetospira]